MFENHWDDADWFMKADDDTFVVVENLRNLLKDFNTTDPISFGHNFKYLGVSKMVIRNDVLVYIFFCSGLLFWRSWLCLVQGGSEKVYTSRAEELLPLQGG